MQTRLIMRPLRSTERVLTNASVEEIPRCRARYPPADRFCQSRVTPHETLLRVGQVVADGGACEETRIIPAAWIDDIVQNGSADAWDAGVFAPFVPGRKMHYRNKWYVDLGEAPLLFALGIHGQYLFVDRRNQLVIVMRSSQADPLDAELILLTMTAVSHFREIFALSQ